jgi:hypothetical protein
LIRDIDKQFGWRSQDMRVGENMPVLSHEKTGAEGQGFAHPVYGNQENSS